MMTRLLHNRLVQAFVLLGFTLGVAAQGVNLETYYEEARGKAGSELKTALHEVAQEGHVKQGYYAVSRFFEQYDLTDNGLIWDLYAEPRCDRWSGCGLNREHSMPKSWFGISSGHEEDEPIGCDYHNLYPSDREANSAKSNYPLGETTGGRFNNGVCKVGNNTYPGYTGIVFEPADEYKGDFARTYMYMVTRYEDYASRWTSTGTRSMLTNTTYPTFNSYAVNLLMAWHRADPVSRKETDRNEAVYRVQGNRNPFVDYPELAEYLWGDKQGERWNYTPFSLTPQPDGTLYVLLERQPGSEVHYEVYGINGVKMTSGALPADGMLSVSSLPAGLYLLTAYADGVRYTGRFVR